MQMCRGKTMQENVSAHVLQAVMEREGQ